MMQMIWLESCWLAQWPLRQQHPFWGRVKDLSLSDGSLSLPFSMLKHLNESQTGLASLSANATANYDRVLLPQQVSTGVRSVLLSPTYELGCKDSYPPRGWCIRVVAPISWAAGICSADMLVLVKYGVSVFCWLADQQVWKSGWWRSDNDTYHTGIILFHVPCCTFENDSYKNPSKAVQNLTACFSKSEYIL